MSQILFFAEDDPLMSRMYEKAFKVSGFDLTVAFDGDQAIQALKTMDPKPVIVLLDVMMPKKSGFEVLREMKSDDKLKAIPTILLTNLAGEQDAEKGLQLGAVAYLVKSQYSPMEIVAKVQEIARSYSRKEGIPEIDVPIKDIGDTKK